MTGPRHDYRDPVTGQFAKRMLVYPQGSTSHPTIVETGARKKSRDPVAFLTAHPEASGAFLVGQEISAGDNNATNEQLVYETLPGPWVSSTRIDWDGATVTIQSRTNIAANVVTAESVTGSFIKTWTRTTLTPSGNAITGTEVVESRVVHGNTIVSSEWDDELGKVTVEKTLIAVADTPAINPALQGTIYSTEAYPGSDLVCMQVKKTWDMGTTHINTTVFYDENKGPVERTTRVVIITGSQEGSFTVSSGVVTEERFEPHEANPLICRRVRDTWDIPGPVTTSEKLNEDGTTSVVSRRLTIPSDVTEGETLTGIAPVSPATVVTSWIWERTESEPFNEVLVWKVSTRRILPGNTLVESIYEEASDTVIEKWTTLKPREAITEGAQIVSESGADVLYTCSSKPVSSLVSEETITRFPRSSYYDADHALQSTKTMPYRFPGRMASLYYGETVKEPFVRVVTATVKTWWVISATMPVVAPISIATKNLSMITYERTGVPPVKMDRTWNDMITNARQCETVVGPGTSVTWNIGASTPSYTEYVVGTTNPTAAPWIGSSKVIEATVTPDPNFKRWKVETTSIIMQ